MALGSDITLVLVAEQGQKQQIDELLADLWKAIFQFEKQFSRFLPNSELSRFNLSAGQNTIVSQEFYDLLKVAKYYGESTGGLFNPFILPALHRIGYKQSLVPGYTSDKQIDYSRLEVADISELKLGDNWACIPYGSALDVGGCGKGYLADQLKRLVNVDFIRGYWLSLGGDIVGGGTDVDGEPWKVKISDANNSSKDSDLQIITSGKDFAVATSGTSVRQGVHSGKKWHHILDPRTQKPAKTDITMATIYGDSATQADVLASCAIILGSRKALPFLKKQTGVRAALLQGTDETGARTEHSFGKEFATSMEVPNFA